MLSTKEQIKVVKEYMKMNKPIVDMNAKVAQRYIQENNIKSRKKKAKNSNSSEKSAYDIFMEEATKMILEDAIEYWMENKSINNQKDIDTNFSKITLNEENNIDDLSLKNKKDIKDKSKDNIEITTTKSKNKKSNSKKAIKSTKTTKSNKFTESLEDYKKFLKQQKITAKDLFKDVTIVEESAQIAFF